MRNVFIIARKELLSLTRQRNTLLLMFVSPIVLVAIMGLAFSSLAGSGAPSFADIRVAVVNQDAGFSLQQHLPASVTIPSLADVELTVDGQSVNLGEQLQQNENLKIAADDLATSDLSLNFGNQLAAILLSQPISGSSMVSGVAGGFDLDAITCPLLPDEEQGENAFSGSLGDLFDAEAVSDVGVARAGVERGDYAAAVIIPADFSNYLAPDFGLSATSNLTTTGRIEILANNATPISASIVRAVVEGIAGQFESVNVALSALVLTTADQLSTLEDGDGGDGGNGGGNLDASGFNIQFIMNTLQSVDASALEPLGCLIMPGAGNIEIARQALSEVQERSPFSVLMVILGGAQAIFFALFTGVFGINSIYEDRRQGTLQRVLASPTASRHVLWGRLLGNLLIVFSQILVLLTAYAAIASVVEGKLTFIWGTNLLALLLVVAALSLFTTGMGVLIVGLAKSSEQVQLFGPMITLALGALGGVFGPVIPVEYGRFSPIWWGLDAMQKLAANEGGILLNLLVLFGVGLLFATVGTYFFRRRMEI